MNPRLLFVLSLSAVLVAGCASETDDEEESDDATGAVVGGSKTSTAHPSVGYLVQPSGTRHCTGTLIAPDIVLSAAHCWQGPSELHFGVGDFKKGKKTYRAKPSGSELYPYAFVHPDFGKNGEGSNDLAYVVLEEAVPASVAKPAKLGDYTDVDKCAFELIGYGRSTAGENDRTDGFLDERKTATFCLTGKDGATGLVKAKGVDGTSCVGDSGGGLMIKGAKSDTLAAVVRGGESCTIGATALFTPVNANSAFIKRALAASKAR